MKLSQKDYLRLERFLQRYRFEYSDSEFRAYDRYDRCMYYTVAAEKDIRKCRILSDEIVEQGIVAHSRALIVTEEAFRYHLFSYLKAQEELDSLPYMEPIRTPNFASSENLIRQILPY